MQGAAIHIVSVPVSDQDAAMRWYTEVLGFTVTQDAEIGPGMRWVLLAAPGGGAAITLTTWFESMAPGSRKGTVLSVPDVDAAAAHLRGVGALAPDAAIEDAPWGRFVQVDDPDGNGWVVQQDR